MANKLYEESHIQAIADAIREKNGTSDSYLVSEMGDAIRAIQGSGSSNTEDNFDDLTVVESGTCGENVTWQLYDNGTLRLTGSGSTYDYYDEDFNPESYPFAEREDIYRIVIEDGITRIGDFTFAMCWYAESIFISNSVTYIGECAFVECGFSSVNIPDSVINIDYYAFGWCQNLREINIPDSVLSIGEYAFVECYSLVSVNIPSGISVISTGMFNACYNITSVIIPNSIKIIADEAFSSTGLININIPDSVTHIGTHAFSGCYNLTNITLPASLTTISDYMFANCQNLISVTLPSSIISIGDNAFIYCRNLVDINLHNNITYFGKAVFFGCNSLINITMPDNLTYINSDMFGYCEKLSAVVVPRLITNIKERAFIACNNLSLITYKGNATEWNEITIEDENDPLFTANIQFEAEDTPLHEKTITENGEYEPDRGFIGFSKVIVDVTTGGSSSGNTTFVKSIIERTVTEITEEDLVGITQIGSCAFYECASIISVTIPSGVISIGNSAFNSCANLTSITIGNDVTSIGEWVFYNCPSLTNIYLTSTTPPSLGNIYAIPIGTTTIHVPVGSGGAYKSATNWSSLAGQIVEYE